MMARDVSDVKCGMTRDMSVRPKKNSSRDVIYEVSCVNDGRE